MKKEEEIKQEEKRGSNAASQIEDSEKINFFQLGKKYYEESIKKEQEAKELEEKGRDKFTTPKTMNEFPDRLNCSESRELKHSIEDRQDNFYGHYFEGRRSIERERY